MAKPTYAELLKHPNWQRKRLEVLKASDFTCQWCGDTEKTLHVHHGYYEKGMLPWDYPDESLHVLCEDCHINQQVILQDTHAELGKLPLVRVLQVYGYILGLHAWTDKARPVTVAVREVAVGVADAFGLSTEQVLQARDDERAVTGIRLTAPKLEALK